MNENVTLIITVSLIIIFSPFFAKALRLPTTPIEIILGAVLAALFQVISVMIVIKLLNNYKLKNIKI